MTKLIIRVLEAALIVGMFVIVNFGQTPAVPSAHGNAGSVGAVLENKSNKSVLIWAAGFAPKTLADTAKFRVAPGTKRNLAVTVPADGLVKFVASAGPTADKSDITGPTLGTCTWRQEPNVTNKVPYVVYTGSGLTCGNTTR